MYLNILLVYCMSLSMCGFYKKYICYEPIFPNLKLLDGSDSNMLVSLKNIFT